MTAPTLTTHTTDPLGSTAEVLVIAASSSPAGVVVHSIVEAQDVAEQLSALGFSGSADELLRLPAPRGSARSWAVIGLGRAPDANALRSAAGSAVRQLAGAASVAFAVPVADGTELGALLEGAALGSYSFTRYRSASTAAAKTPVGEITVFVDGAPDGADDGAEAGLPGPDALSRLAARASIAAEAIATVKDLVNIAPSDLYPDALARFAVDLAAGLPDGLPLDVRVWDESQLEADGFGGILGVGQGSSRPPRLVKVSYAPSGASSHLALVGKGITFDTGGLSLKPPASMVGMKYDMTGAATVLAVTVAAARLALPIRITAWLCIAENMPSGSATRPNDVLTIRGGRTVEVLNTDAEGRLVMADGLVAASEEHPDHIIDVATLTGAQTVALGTRYAGVMGDDALVAQVIAAASAAGETMWPMPLPAELRSILSSDVADIANAKPGNPAAGMLVAGVFLREFVGRTGEGDDAPRIPWAHLDIAGPANNKDSAYGFTGKGPTGIAVRTLLELSEELSRR
ncbi:leucyl aminopeptidase [Compostimonas suwonensis]|nr:leucyl aminopeptidase [Compostimonas suwonensis]